MNPQCLLTALRLTNELESIPTHWYLSTVDNSMFFKSNEIFQSRFSTNCIDIIKKGASSLFVLRTAQQEGFKVLALFLDAWISVLEKEKDD